MVRPYYHNQEKQFDELVIVRPYVHRSSAKSSSLIKERQSPLEKLPPELRCMIYRHLFVRFPDTVTFAKAIPKVPVILQAVPALRREDLPKFYLPTKRLVITVVDGHPQPAYFQWTRSGICERIAHVEKVHLVWKLYSSIKPEIEVTVAFRTSEAPARILSLIHI